VVTGTGGATARTTIRRAEILRQSVGPRVEVKAAGRLRKLDELRQAADAGAVRVSTVLTETLVRQAADGLQPARAAR
jgi:deoxyribose-phosphate aldolase